VDIIYRDDLYQQWFNSRILGEFFLSNINSENDTLFAVCVNQAHELWDLTYITHAD